MNIETCKTFVNMCEALTEASTTMNLITNQPGGVQVVRKLHKDMRLAHDIDYKPVEKISWSELKDAYVGAWVIIQGSKGTGAIQARNGSYNAIASTGEDAESFSDARGGNVLDFLKSKIGKLVKFYVGKNTRAVSDKQQKRSELKTSASATSIDKDSIVRKFKPLWAKAVTTAIADIKGHIANQISNDAFEKARQKLEHISRLQTGLEQIESGSNVPDFISTAVQQSIYMAASYYYPEETGEITRGYGRSLQTERSEGPRRLLNDITQGDTKKLGTILAYFKRNLISG